jgi:hypothetical protein
MKAKNITPKEGRCIVGACPSCFETDYGTIIVIGRQVPSRILPLNVRRKLGAYDIAVQVPRKTIPLK